MTVVRSPDILVVVCCSLVVDVVVEVNGTSIGDRELILLLSDDEDVDGVDVLSIFFTVKFNIYARDAICCCLIYMKKKSSFM